MTEGIDSIVVVGGGLGGVSACEELRRRGYTGTLTLLDEGELLHDRPPLSKDYLSGVADDDAIRLKPQAWYQEQSVDVLLGAVVERVLPDEDEVLLADGRRLPAQRVVLATGGTARRLPVPGADDPRVLTLRTVDDARALKELLTPGVAVLVVGAGLIGAEVAATARTLGADVVLTDPLLPLQGILGREVAAGLHAQHTAHGVELLDAGIETITPGDRLTVHFADGSSREVDAVVVGIGMVPDTRVAEASGLAVDGGVLVDAAQRTSADGVWAIGDCARSVVDGVPQPRAEHWEAATVTAARAAADILGTEPPTASAAWWWSDRYGHHLEAVGDPTRGEQVVRGTLGEPPFAVFAVEDGAVVGAIAVDQPMAVKAARRMIDRRTAVDPAKLADPGTDLRKLLRG